MYRYTCMYDSFSCSIYAVCMFIVISNGSNLPSVFPPSDVQTSPTSSSFNAPVEIATGATAMAVSHGDSLKPITVDSSSAIPSFSFRSGMHGQMQASLQPGQGQVMQQQPTEVHQQQSHELAVFLKMRPSIRTGILPNIRNIAHIAFAQGLIPKDIQRAITDGQMSDDERTDRFLEGLEPKIRLDGTCLMKFVEVLRQSDPDYHDTLIKNISKLVVYIIIITCMGG